MLIFDVTLYFWMFGVISLNLFQSTIQISFKFVGLGFMCFFAKSIISGLDALLDRMFQTDSELDYWLVGQWSVLRL